MLAAPRGVFSPCGEQASGCSGFLLLRGTGSWAPGLQELQLVGSLVRGCLSTGSIVVAHGLKLLGSIWDLPGSGIEPVSPALAGGFFTTELPGKPYLGLFV